MSADTSIRVSGLGKKFAIGHQSGERYEALRDVLARSARSFVRSAGDMLRGRPIYSGDEIEEFWALRNLDFEIQRGDTVGIIGRNGAGKSTLLKILSRITEPSEGRVEIRGRVASLLEVGTGFHPELTGRENIFLNGAILGMSRREIWAKFDEIVSFAGVEKFLDTPVKRYSSGMHVRLAFSVAAHLEPDILIVDEVLAVGDAEFQKKCLGKMQDVAGHGRTVLFVSHNMAAVASLTRRAIVLSKGGIAHDGPTSDAIKAYSALGAAVRTGGLGPETYGRGRHTRITSVALLDEYGAPTGQYVSGSALRLRIALETDGTRGLSFDLQLVDERGAKIALASLSHFEGRFLPSEPGGYHLTISLAPLHLAAGKYSIDAITAVVNHAWDHYVEDAMEFEVLFSNPNGLPWNFSQSYGYGAVALFPVSPTVIEQAGRAQSEHNGEVVGRKLDADQ